MGHCEMVGMTDRQKVAYMEEQLARAEGTCDKPHYQGMLQMERQARDEKIAALEREITARDARIRYLEAERDEAWRTAETNEIPYLESQNKILTERCDELIRQLSGVFADLGEVKTARGHWRARCHALDKRLAAETHVHEWKPWIVGGLPIGNQWRGHWIRAGIRWRKIRHPFRTRYWARYGTVIAHMIPHPNRGFSFSFYGYEMLKTLYDETPTESSILDSFYTGQDDEWS